MQIRQALQARCWQRAQQLAEAALAAAGVDTPSGELHLLLAQARWWQGQLERVHRPALRAAVLVNPPAQRIQALNLAALALAELGLADEALPLVNQALDLAREPELHAQLSRTLSCAGHVYARLGDVEHAVPLHMQALSLARDGRELEPLLQAYANLLLSTAMAHEELLEQGEREAAHAALLRGMLHLSYARGLLRDERLREEQRCILSLMLGRVLMLSERADEAEPLLRSGLALAATLGSHYYGRGGRLSLAELLRRRQQCEQALMLLPEPVDGDGGCLRVAELRCRLACHRQLAQEDAARLSEQQLHQALARRDATREQARRLRVASPSQFGDLAEPSGFGPLSR